MPGYLFKLSKAILLIIGLGNPGAQYDGTRHNAGFWYVDELARQYNASFSIDKKYNAEICQVLIAGEKVTLLKPLTFMNLSGQSVAAYANFYKIPAEQILVAHDELDFEPGKVKLKQGGGHGGHNGLRDIIARLGNKNFLRLRIGIGHPGHSSQVSNYVLGKPHPDDKISIINSIDTATRVTPDLIKGELQKAMQNLH